VRNSKADIKTERDGQGGLDSFGSGWRQVAGSCEDGTEPSGTIKDKDID
jgi:hypothetical protein